MENTDLSITVKDINAVEKQIQVTIPADTVTRELDKYYLTLRKSVKIKGFRPGKVPRSILERFYKKQVENEVVQQLVNDSYQSALKEKNIRAVSPPIIDNEKLEAGKDLTYTARVEIPPKFDLPETYVGLEVDQGKLDVTEGDVDKYLDEMRNFHSQLNTLESDRPVSSGDYVLIDYTGSIDGVPLKEGEVKDKLIEIKPDSFLPGFTNQMLGLKAGVNREITVTLPEDYEQKEIAGKTLIFQVTIKEIKEKIVPPLDDNFARDVGEFETLSHLRDQVKKELTIREEQRIQNALHTDIIKKILDETPFDVPPSLVHKQTEFLILQARSQMTRQGLQLDSSTMINRELQEAYRPMAELQVKRSFVLEEIARREGIEVAESELQERLKLLAVARSQNPSVTAGGSETEEDKEQVKARVLEDKTLAFLKEKAHITIVEKENTA